MTDAPVVRSTVASEGDEFMLSVPRVTGRLVRTGRGADRASVTAMEVDAVHLVAIDIGFPAAAEAEVVGDAVILATMMRTPPDGVWDGTPLRRGQTFVYPPGGAHHAKDPAGLQFALTVVPWGTFEAAAENLGFDPSPGRRQHVVSGGALPESVLSAERLGHSVAAQPVSSEILVDELVDSAVRTLCVSDQSPRRGPVRRWEDADLVHEALLYLDAMPDRWMVPMLVLCRHVGVSERRLQTAFRAMVGIAPSDFMRYRALQAAHRALRQGQPGVQRVAEIARAHGFRHLGRFAAYYRTVYGELPSATLNRQQHRFIGVEYSGIGTMPDPGGAA